MQGAIQAAGYRPSDENNMMDNDRMLSGFLNDVFFGHGLSELRLFPVDGSGIQIIVVDGLESAWKVLEKTDGAFNIYCTFNQLKKGYAKKGGGGAASNADVTARLFFFVDVDSPGHSDKSIMPDTQSAVDKAKEIIAWLVDKNWPQPYVACSGGGVHLFWKVGWKTLKEDEELFRGGLEALSEQFGEQVDTAVWNSARIARVPGPPNVSYYEVLGNGLRRPLELDTEVYQLGTGTISREQLEELAGWRRAKTKTYRETGGFALDGWVEKVGLEYKARMEWGGGPMYILPCPWCGGKDFHLGQPNGGVFAKCFHNSCKDKGWPEFRAMFETEEEWQPTAANELNDLGNAQRFVDFLQGRLVYNRSTGEWWWWNSELRIWLPLYESQEIELIIAWLAHERRIAEDIWDDAQRFSMLSWIEESGQNAHATALMKWVKGLVGKNREAFNAQTHLLGAENCVVDMRTGEAIENNMEYLITQYAPTEYVQDPEIFSPLWKSQLLKMADGKMDRVRWVQRMMGYWCTGETGEQKWFFWFGGGKNGKSTAVDVVRGVLGNEYTQKLSDKFLVITRSDLVPNEKAQLDGCRLAVAGEIPKGARINEGLVKELSGESAVKSRHMQRKWFEFDSRCKVLLQGNEKPLVTDFSLGFWRKVEPWFMTYTIPQSERKLDYHKVILAEEQKEIFSWLGEGAHQWYERGLASPNETRLWAMSWKAEADSIGMFLEDVCEEDAGCYVGVTSLRECYVEWCAKNGPKPVDVRDWNLRLREQFGKAENKWFTVWKNNIPKKVQLKAWTGLKVVDTESTKVRVVQNDGEDREVSNNEETGQETFLDDDYCPNS